MPALPPRRCCCCCDCRQAWLPAVEAAGAVAVAREEEDEVSCVLRLNMATEGEGTGERERSFRLGRSWREERERGGTWLVAQGAVRVQV